MRSAFQKKLMKPKEVVKLDNTINEVLFLLFPLPPWKPGEGGGGGRRDWKADRGVRFTWVAVGLLCGGNTVGSY